MNNRMQGKFWWTAAAVVVLVVTVFSGTARTVLAAQANGSDDKPALLATRPAGEQEFFGVVESISGTQLVVSGKTINTSGAEMKTQVSVGDMVKVHLSQNADGTLVAREVELARGGSIAGFDDSVDDVNDDMDDDVNDDMDDDVNDDHDRSGSDDDSGADIDDDHGGDSGSDDGSSHDSEDDDSGHGGDDSGSDDDSSGHDGSDD